jgi:hypothetical protein
MLCISMLGASIQSESLTGSSMLSGYFFPSYRHVAVRAASCLDHYITAMCSPIKTGTLDSLGHP